MYLVWVQGLKGPEPQIWIDYRPTSDHSYLAKHKLTEEEINLFSIDQLAKKYPYGLGPEPPPDTPVPVTSPKPIAPSSSTTAEMENVA